MLLEERSGHYRPPESELEQRFARLTDRLRPAGWLRQVDLGNGDSWIGRVDFLHPASTVVVELDGAVAHSSFMDTANDRERDRRLAAAGFRVLRFGWAEVVHDPVAVLAAVRAATATTSV